MSYRLPDCLAHGDYERARGYLGTYYGTGTDEPSTGSYFDAWAVERSEPDRFTADDLVAVSCLSVFVPPIAARELLVRAADQFADLLKAIGPDRDLSHQIEAVDEEAPASHLFAAVRRLPGVGRTIASKLCARKRPRLVPIYDSVIAKVTDIGKYHWEPLRVALRDDRLALHDRLHQLREETGLPAEISILRVYDVITWMEGREKKVRPTAPAELLGEELAERTDTEEWRPSPTHDGWHQR